MPEGLSMYAEKVYNAMKAAEIDSEDKMANAERIVGLTKAPKNFVLRSLDELQAKGLVKRKAREKSAGYYIVEGLNPCHGKKYNIRHSNPDPVDRWTRNSRSHPTRPRAR
jgi:hypothetical protein